MGNLKPNVTYIYEKANGVTYAREFGADPKDRFPIGWDVDQNGSTLYNHIPESYLSSKVWFDILKEAETSPALQTAISRVIMLYKLSKEKYE